MNKRALITGANGQMAKYLIPYLLDRDYEVFGTIRRHSMYEHEAYRLKDIKNVNLVYADLLDPTSLTRAFEISKPDEVYHLAAQSHVAVSFDQSIYTVNSIVNGTLYVLEIIRSLYPKTRLFHAGTSEMFGNSCDSNGYQSEKTPMHPVSPYAIAKLCAYNLVQNYRNSYNLFACNGIIFNTESPERGANFVTKKVVKGAIDILNGKSQELVLGNLDSARDWNHASDTVKAIYLITQANEPDDFVCASGESRSIRQLCDYVFTKLNLDYNKYVRVDPKFQRPQELKSLCGYSQKLRTKLNWKPEYNCAEILDEMIEHELNHN